MDTKSSVISSKNVKDVTVRVTPGHFATSHSHVNYYIDLTDVKIHHSMAKRAAAELARRYVSISIGTIICQEGTEMIGAFMADSLSQPDFMAMNAGSSICVLSPELNTNNQLIFRDNTLKAIRNNNIILLISSISTGKTVGRAIDCIKYYSGNIAGISTLFSVVPNIQNIPVNSIFTNSDIPGYQVYSAESCAMCAGNQQLDAIINGFGYSKL